MKYLLKNNRKFAGGIAILLIVVILLIINNQRHFFRERVSPIEKQQKLDESSQLSDEKAQKKRRELEEGAKDIFGRDGTIEDVEAGYSLLGQNGMVTTEALELAGLKASDAPKIEKIIANTWKDLSELTLKHSDFKSEESNAEKGIYVFEINAFPEEGDKALEDMKKNLEASFGAQPANILSRGLHAWQYFGNFGRYTRKVRIEPNADYPELEGNTKIHVEFIDSRTGSKKGMADYKDPKEMQHFMGFTDKDLITN